MLKLHHLGIIVENIEQAITDYKLINDNFSIILKEDVKQQLVKIALIKDEVFTLEFVEPLSPKSPVYNFSFKGGGLHHLCYETDDIEQYLEKYKAEIKIVKNLGEGFLGLKTAFFVPRKRQEKINLIELVEIKNDA